MFNIDETRKDQSIVVHNTETTIPVTSSAKTVRDANENGFAEPGELLSYKIHVSNDGTVPARGIQIKDTLSDLLAHIDAPGTNLLTVSIGSEIVNKTVQDLMNGFVIRLDPGESADIHFDVKVKSTLDTDLVKKLSNLATVGSDKPTVEIPTGSPKFKAAKSVNDANGNMFAEPGERLNYTLSVTNTGNVKANGVSVVDDLNEMLDHIEDPKANVVTISNDGVTSTTTVGALMNGLSLDISAGKSVIITFSVDVKSSLDVKKTNFLRNIATLGTETPLVDINTGKDDLSALKTVIDANGNQFAEPGEKLTYTITATNDGNLPAKDVLVQDKLTKLLPHILDPKDNLVTATNGSVVTTFTLKDLISGKSFTIDKNSSLSLTFSVTLKDEVEADLLENDATVRNIPVHTELPYGELTLESLKEVKDGNNNHIAEPGESLTYTLSSINKSGFTAEKVFIQDSLSELLDHIEDPSLVNVSMTNGTVSGTIKLSKLMSGFEVDILDGDTLTLKFTLKVLETLDPKETPVLTNIATVGEELPPVSIDTGKPELMTSKVVRDANDNGYAEKGEVLTYILSVTNNGNVNSEDILVKDDLADLLSYIKDPRLGLVSISENGVSSSKTVQDLMNGFTVEVVAGSTNTYQFTVQVIDDLDFDEVKFLANKAVIGEDEPETDIETATPILSATKTVYDENEDNYAEPGETLLYEIKITNSGKVKQEDLFVQDSFSQLMLYIDDPLENLVTVTKLDEIETYTFQELLDGLYLDIEVDETIIMLFSVTIREDLKFEGIKDLTNIAVVGDQHPIVVIDVGDDDLRAEKEVVDENGNEFAEPGELLTYTIRAYNDGNVASAQTMVRDTLEKLLPHIEDPRTGIVSVVNDGVSSTITVAELMAGKLYVIAAEKELSLTFSVRLKEQVEASLLENEATVGTLVVKTELPYGEYKLLANKIVRDANENLLAEPNEELTYILSARNLSQFAVQDVLIKDSLDLLLPYIENPDSVQVTMYLGSDSSTFSLKKLMDGFKIDLLSDESMTLEFTVKVLGTLDTKEVRELKNIAIIGEEIPPVTIETGSSNLEVQKYVVDETGDGRAMSSEKLTYFIKINNTGNVDLKEVSIRDTLEMIKDYFIDPKTEILYINVDGVVHEMFVGDLMLGMSMDIDAHSHIELRFELKLKANLSKDLRMLHNIAEINDLRPEVKIIVIHPVDPRTGGPDPTPTVPTKVVSPNKTGQALPQTGVQVDISPYLLILGGLLILLKTIRKKTDL